MVATAKRAIALQKSVATTSARRRTLNRKGMRIGQSVAYVLSKADSSVDEKLRVDILREISTDRYKEVGRMFSFVVHGAKWPMFAKSKSAKRKAEGGGRYHLVGAIDARRQRLEPRVQAKKRAASTSPDVLVIAMEQDNEIKYTKTIYRR